MTHTSGTEVVLHDATLRDGQHEVGHQMTEDQLRRYAEAADRAGVPVVEVGHGNGLGASSLQIGRARLSDAQMLDAVRPELASARMGVFMAPGWGTGSDIRAAVAAGAGVVRVAAHCTEANVTRRHLGLVRDLGVQAQTVLLMSHMAEPTELARQCALAVSYGAQAVGIMDSAGALLPGDVTARVSAIASETGVPVIFHGHNNLGLAVGNSLAAVQAGARIVDVCAQGIGAGAGNTPLEVMAAVLQRCGYETGVQVRAALAAAEVAREHLMDRAPQMDPVSIVSGLEGVFSGFRLPVLAAAEKAGVDPLEVFAELGRRRAVAGQEDLIPVAVDAVAQTAALAEPVNP
ncbi:4-hydroxy-2-oxovalerate aldolase [Peterkaempfera bronchialis]|uniref:4-hydroxy-2-oxovalerate aldolase n=1 Tax=Peterkaempfera bronchialis TaxID=2126346 RepID=A0A345STA6_9ACTN|nr:4-hydroxy-2-oxovalerate aldolase [Peterkaempfera bronchialis]AXI76961.1 4-hydroxy-2-oxovalerate aldolase [Peterkaempfera bronchialis]